MEPPKDPDMLTAGPRFLTERVLAKGMPQCKRAAPAANLGKSVRSAAFRRPRPARRATLTRTRRLMLSCFHGGQRQSCGNEVGVRAGPGSAREAGHRTA